jgi:hypothetical protein
MKIFPDFHKPLRQAQVDLGYKRQMHAQEENKSEAEKRRSGTSNGARFLNEEYFAKAMEEMIMLRFPSKVQDEDEKIAILTKVLMESAMMMPEVNQKAWNEAKRLAMLAEGRKYSASTRIQSTWRRVTCLERYLAKLRMVVMIQVHMRRKRCELRYAARGAYLLEDVFYRQRWAHAIVIQMAFRRFVAVRDFKVKVVEKHDLYLKRCRSRREKHHRRRVGRESKAMFKRVRTVNGTLTLQEMFRAASSASGGGASVGDDDLGVRLQVYVPVSQKVFSFDIPDKNFREFLYQATGKATITSANEVLEKKNLSLICDRLMCRSIGGLPIVYMSKKTISERGVQVARRGIHVPGGGRIVVTCFWSNDEVVFQTYDCRDSRPMRTSITMVVLKAWLTDEMVWEKKRHKRELNKRRGEARKLIRKHGMQLPVDAMHLEWAFDFLGKTGGDVDTGVVAFVADDDSSLGGSTKEVEQPIEEMLADQAEEAKDKALRRRLEAEAEMLGWTDDSVNALAALTGGAGADDGSANGSEMSLAHKKKKKQQQKKEAARKKKKEERVAAALAQGLTVDENDDGDLSSSDDDDDDEDDETDEDEDESVAKKKRKKWGRWGREYRRRFPGMHVPPDNTNVEDELLEMGEDPPMLKGSKRPQLIDWLLSKLNVARFKQGERRGQPQLVLAYELDLDNQAEAAAIIQGLQRMFLARKRARGVTMRVFERRFDRDSHRFYYVFVPTEQQKHSAEAPWQWRKPRMLDHRGLNLDCAAPVDEWRDMYTHATQEELLLLKSGNKREVDSVTILSVKGTSQEDGPPVTGKYYINCATGQQALLSLNEAAAKIQLVVRDFLAREIGKVTTKQMIKALKIQYESEERFAAFPNRLSSIVNWALVLHVMHHNMNDAKKLYKQAMQISPENPVLLRAVSLFSLLTCEPPRAASWARAMDNLRAAEIRDPTREKFAVAEECLFHWAVVCNPKSARCLLNYALLLQCVVKDYDLADKFYRRAVACDSEDKFVVQNLLDFEAQRLPGGQYAGGGPPLAVLKTSIVEDDKFEWGDWKLMRNERAHDQRFTLYWATELGGRTSWEEPKWQEVWQIILKRSKVVKDLGAWKEYNDPKMKMNFFTNPNAKPEPVFQKDSPYQTGQLKK